MMYFRGCVVREKLTNIADATETILKTAGLDYTILENEPCCGSFLMRTGFEDEALKVMEKTLKQLNKNEGEEILVSCAGCYNTLKNDYKELFGVELNVKHTSELLKELISEGKIKVKKTPKKVTYHDPCHLGRHSDIYEEPREIINETSVLVEMDRNRERSRCCGAGAGVKSAFPETALKVASKRIQDAESTNAEIIITSCSFCILNLENALKYTLDNENRGSVSSVLDITELILMGLEHEEV
ncbi:(Fe-S)-binding protein [Methanobacterium spitsbergense]|uniref:(Fe-S)-binding protein n=1 Tax=Methanobacterium spitsbergense TaxID=2874285 RepID=A0A8T5USB5_9EURY|nr:(Fe-S)-binding protein [Methanobacterium spitsbergense]MBZ2166942.1 (Fe-S)-binding protein [Methanobacterium spitsbergense]